MRETTRRDLRRVADKRIKEAQILFRKKHYAGAYYLAGYAIECALKACLAKSVRRFDFPSLREVNRAYTHDLKRLLKQAKLFEALKRGSAGA